ncbi:uncharacterized protein ACIBXB_017511 [Morphnus guianensis]
MESACSSRQNRGTSPRSPRPFTKPFSSQPAAGSNGHSCGHLLEGNHQLPAPGPHLTRLGGCHERIRTYLRTQLRAYPPYPTPQGRRARGLEGPARLPAYRPARPGEKRGSRRRLPSHLEGAQRLTAWHCAGRDKPKPFGGGGSPIPPFPSAVNELARLRAPLAVPARHARLARARSVEGGVVPPPLGRAQERYLRRGAPRGPLPPTRGTRNRLYQAEPVWEPPVSGGGHRVASLVLEERSSAAARPGPANPALAPPAPARSRGRCRPRAAPSAGADTRCRSFAGPERSLLLQPCPRARKGSRNRKPRENSVT